MKEKLFLPCINKYKIYILKLNLIFLFNFDKTLKNKKIFGLNFSQL